MAVSEAKVRLLSSDGLIGIGLTREDDVRGAVRLCSWRGKAALPRFCRVRGNGNGARTTAALRLH